MTPLINKHIYKDSAVIWKRIRVIYVTCVALIYEAAALKHNYFSR